MKLKPITVPVRCDNGVCPHKADYAVVREGTPVVRELHLCKECLKALAELYAEKFKEAEPKKSRKGGKNVGTNMGNGNQ